MKTIVTESHVRDMFRELRPNNFTYDGLTLLFDWIDNKEIETDEDIINRVKYDIYYLENWSLILDLNIVFLTTINFLTGQKKAY